MDIKKICRLYDLREKAKLIWHVHFNGQYDIVWERFLYHFQDHTITEDEQMDIGSYMIKEFGVSWTPRRKNDA